MNTKILLNVSTIIVVALVGLFLSMSADAYTPKPLTVELFVDPDTGCEYWVPLMAGSIIKRTDSDGISHKGCTNT